jgi:alanine dehydrogenase
MTGSRRASAGRPSVPARSARPTFGFPRMHKERGERRDFLPGLVGRLMAEGCPVTVESGIGSGMGRTDDDYRAVSALVEVADERSAFAQDVVVTLRAPHDRLTWMRPGATLVSMLHFPTRPGRVARLGELGLEAISLDSLADDEGHRLVENMRAVGWNGVEAAFDVLARTCPALTDPGRGPLQVTVLGAGTVGKHAIEAATKYGSLRRAEAFADLNLPGVLVVVAGRNVTADATAMRRLFPTTDVLVDATSRSDTTRPLVPNAWLEWLPQHAVVCDLVVDPYLLDVDPQTVRSIEGIPQGDLDQWTFSPDDPAWERTALPGIRNEHRRTVVSCYSWPGVHPEACMLHYEVQLAPLLATLVDRGIHDLRADGATPAERALRRASLRSWLPATQRRRFGTAAWPALSR